MVVRGKSPVELGGGGRNESPPILYLLLQGTQTFNIICRRHWRSSPPLFSALTDTTLTSRNRHWLSRLTQFYKSPLRFTHSHPATELSLSQLPSDKKSYVYWTCTNSVTFLPRYRQHPRDCSFENDPMSRVLLLTEISTSPFLHVSLTREERYFHFLSPSLPQVRLHPRLQSPLPTHPSLHFPTSTTTPDTSSLDHLHFPSTCLDFG